MLNAEHDIFSNYDCLKNDPVQARFMSVLEEVRQSIADKASNTASLHVEGETGIPDPKLYLAVISSLIVHRLSQNNKAGIPELLRLLIVAMQSATLDSSIAAQLAELTVPLFNGADNALLAALCPVAAALSHRTKFNPVQVTTLIEGICAATLSDDSKVRNTASRAIYDNDNIHQLCFDRLFEICDQNALRALTVLKNIASAAKPGVWTKYAEPILNFCQSDNRAVRVKGFELMSYCLHHLSPETVVSIINKFTAKKPEAPGDVLQSMALLIQSAITMLARESPALLADNFPNFLHQMLMLLTLEDEQARNTINQTILYGIAALTNNAGQTNDFTRLQGIVKELDGALIIQYMTIWPQVFSILSTLPPQLHAATPDILFQPILNALEKLKQDKDMHGKDYIVSFVATCMNEMGLAQFYTGTPELIDDAEVFQYVYIPLINAYNSRKHGTDLDFTIEKILPIERYLYQEKLDNPDDVNRHLVWANLWNALPNCVTTNSDDISEFIEMCCQRFKDHKELIRPISKIFHHLAAKIANMEGPLSLLVNSAIDASTASVSIPAISALCAAKDSASLKDFFHGVAMQCIEYARDPDKMDVSCALVDVILAMCNYVDESYRKMFYDLMLKFVKGESHFQKKALRAIRDLITRFKIEGAVHELKDVLANTGENVTSSTIRYRILLMTTLLQICGDEYGELLSEFLPEIVAAVKDQGEKTRSAAEESLQTIAQLSADNFSSVDAIVAGIMVGIISDDSSFVSASIDSLSIVLRRHYDKVTPETLNGTCDGVFGACKANQKSEVFRSGLVFCKMLLTRVPKYTEQNQLHNIIELSIACNKRTNWEIRDKGHHMIERCIETFGIDPVTNVFPKEELKLLRGARKESNRNQKKAKSNQNKDNDESDGIELDSRYDEHEIDLLSSANIIKRKEVEQKDESDNDELQFDERGRIIMKEAPKTRKSRKEEKDEDEDEDRGNELADYINNRRQKKNRDREEKKAKFVEETGNKFKAPRGKGDVMKKGGQAPFASAPLSAKVVNKRYRSQMKAEYKKLFKRN
ncbi:hypothetical protein TVAG_119620 [Trichomonas vaginalis G3]|uniref:RRP12 HEAT domain-containing protein n=1 Tax=Trichomonas vaginalis (strain ATCC PRA-98 / G3) TaxID=412133 RepID=A2D7A8_TRIV3|nr:maturation of SSU-rRNA [Trichomonas vaginalis G3]EAY23625.1 hypothetical protein TVAG_119620 [Trichomonas vaginalis G3]KAI5490117.1 maturation of SSU-rRNA [Trichomonas vaginalis G3]|eukprot:XP_001276873.1 hypothetical protein [Trichomonas vaginalis G3]